MKAHLRWSLSALLSTTLLGSCTRMEPHEPLRTLPGPQLVLDSSFGDGGEVTSDFERSEGVRALALQKDGKVVAGGLAGRWTLQESADFVLARYLPGGQLDESFGPGGSVFTAAGTAATAPNEGMFKALVVQEDGKILAAGYAALGIDQHYTPGPIIARYNPDGSLDASFGEAGLVRDATGGIGGATALELQPDGKILMAGEGWSTEEVVVARYTPTGQLDVSFASDGILALPYRFTGLGEEPKLLQTSDGDVVLAVDTRLVRLNAAGLRDDTFGQNGEVDTGYPIQAFARQDDGAIVVGQYAEFQYGGLHVQTSPIPPTDFHLMRYTAEGELDTRFGEAGVVVTDINSSEEISSLAVQNDGKIVAAGRTGNAVAVVRYTSSGEVDASFVGAFGGAYTLALDDQNRIIVGGSRLAGDASDFALARFLP